MFAKYGPVLLTPAAIMAILAVQACSADSTGSSDAGGTGGVGGSPAADVGHDGGGGGTVTDATPLPPDGAVVVSDATPVTDAVVADGAPVSDAAVVPDGQVADAGPTIVDEYGFHLRRPTSHEVTCTGFLCDGPTSMAPDKDFVCTLAVGDLNAAIYVQATPRAGDEIAVYLYDSVRAWISRDGVVSEVPGTYSYGGHHADDNITVELPDANYRFGHSSYGFGFRRCQEMDCLQVMSGADVTQDGCTPDRTLPIVCVAVAEDGTHPALVDTFAPCPGDPNHSN